MGQGGILPWPLDPPQIERPGFAATTLPVGRLGSGGHCWVPSLGADSNRFSKKKLLEPTFKFFFPSPFQQDEEH